MADPCCPCCGTTERRPEGLAIDQPGELGYQCPHCGRGNVLDGPGFNADDLTWSEWASHLWCYHCEKDIPTAQCPIRKQRWMSDEWFAKFIAGLPFKAIVVPSPTVPAQPGTEE